MMMIGMIVLPFILNARYMKSGLEIPVGDTEPGLVPSLEVAPEIAMQSNNEISSDKNFPEIKDLNLD